MKEQLRRIDTELLEINRRIMDLKTELRIAEGRRKKLFEEHNTIVMGLQYELNKKEERKG